MPKKPGKPLIYAAHFGTATGNRRASNVFPRSSSVPCAQPWSLAFTLLPTFCTFLLCG